MIVYPGGTYFDRAANGYTFFQDSLSDLGVTVAWNGQRNPAWAIHLLVSVPTTTQALAVPVSLQKVVAASLDATIILQAYEAEIVAYDNDSTADAAV